jgi:hypothetical protein
MGALDEERLLRQQRRHTLDMTEVLALFVAPALIGFLVADGWGRKAWAVPPTSVILFWLALVVTDTSDLGGFVTVLIVVTSSAGVCAGLAWRAWRITFQADRDLDLTLCTRSA